MDKVVLYIAAELGLNADINTATLLSNCINTLILEDFPKLIFLLYRYDIDEVRLREILKSNTADSGTVIASLLIARYHEKKISRANTARDPDIPEDEKW